MATELSWNAVTASSDGSPLVGAVSYTAYIDTVNPPVKAYPVPSTDAPVAGVLTATFASLGFVPVGNTTYYADVTATDTAGTSVPSGVVTFSNAVAPAAPTGLKAS